MPKGLRMWIFVEYVGSQVAVDGGCERYMTQNEGIKLVYEGHKAWGTLKTA